MAMEITLLSLKISRPFPIRRMEMARNTQLMKYDEVLTRRMKNAAKRFLTLTRFERMTIIEPFEAGEF